MTEQHEYRPKYKSQFELINQYKSRLENLSPNGSVEIKPVFIKEGDSSVRGFRILLNKNDQAKKGLITDWDDTLENYSKRKPKYFTKLYEFVDKDKFNGIDHFKSVCAVINKAARVLNWQSINPESYSSFLEMITQTQLFKDADQEYQSSEFRNLLEDPSENNARAYILNRIVPLLGDSITTETKNGKLYFKETQPQSLAHALDEKHDFVSNDVWLNFNEGMTSANLSQSDMDMFDLDDLSYWAISTFGEVDFQLSKIVNSLEELKVANKRLPNEIMIITQGRKNLALKQLISEKPDCEWTYVDDSNSQLESMEQEQIDINLVKANREDTKRYVEESDFSTSNMKAPLSSLLA